MIYLYILLAMFVLLLVCAPYMLWCDYLAVMTLKRVKDDRGLSTTVTRHGTYLLVRGYLLDAFVNIIHMTILLREFPRELTVTRRITRHVETGSGWNQSICLHIRTTYLDHFDPSGIHK